MESRPPDSSRAARESTIVCLGAVASHLAVFALFGRGFDLVSEEYFVAAVVLLPLFVIAMTVTFVRTRSWRARHAAGPIFLGLLLGFLQFLLIGAASASV